MHIFADRKTKTMRGLITILLAGFLLVGCAWKEEAHPRPDISMATDSAAYIEMLEKEITQKVMEKERNTRSMMLAVMPFPSSEADTEVR